MTLSDQTNDLENEGPKQLKSPNLIPLNHGVYWKKSPYKILITISSTSFTTSSNSSIDGKKNNDLLSRGPITTQWPRSMRSPRTPKKIPKLAYITGNVHYTIMKAGKIMFSRTEDRKQLNHHIQCLFHPQQQQTKYKNHILPIPILTFTLSEN